MWCALFEEITARAEEIAGEKKTTFRVKGYDEYKDIEAAAFGEVLVFRRWRAVVGKFFVVKLYSRKIFLYVLCTKIFLQRKTGITAYRSDFSSI